MSKGAGFKKQPTVWPTGAFITIKFFQAIAFGLVLGILVFFSYHLKKESFAIPWQFLSVGALAALSFLGVFATGVFFCCGALNPLFVMIYEGIFSLLWAFASGIMGKGMGGNTIRSCKVWRSTQGMVVCHLFKTLFAFCILSWFAMVCGVILSSSVRKRASSHKYQPANPASLQQTTAYHPQSGIGQTSVPYGQGGTYKAQDDNQRYS